MSNSLAIAAVTRTLQNMLTTSFMSDLSQDAVNALNNSLNLGNTKVTTKPPDKAVDSNQNINQINLFLYQATIQPEMRNMDMPGRTKPYENGHPPAPLDLHYVVTAFGQDNDDARAHILMGQVVRIFHDRPVLNRADIQAALIENDLHEQVERVRITPEPLSIEEMSKLWSTFQTQYRVSNAYQVSVVLIESRRPAKTPLPVLRRGANDQGVVSQPSLIPPYPMIERVELPAKQFNAVLGDTLELWGHHLSGDTVEIVFDHSRLSSSLIRTPEPASDPGRVLVKIPAVADDPGAPAAWPPGLYRVSARVTTGTDVRSSNVMSLALAPEIQSISPANPAPGDITFAFECLPQVRLEQDVALLLSSVEIPVEPFVIPGSTSDPSMLTFEAKDIDAGTYFARLRVDGVDSPLIVYSGAPPKPQFDPQVQVIVA